MQLRALNNYLQNKNPEFVLSDFGDYEVTQEVTSAEGCRSSVTQTITVQDAADVAMEVTTACFRRGFSIF